MLLFSGGAAGGGGLPKLGEAPAEGVAVPVFVSFQSAMRWPPIKMDEERRKVLVAEAKSQCLYMTTAQAAAAAPLPVVAPLRPLGLRTSGHSGAR